MHDGDGYLLSSDDLDRPTYTHETIITPNVFAGRVVGIIEENKDHIPYLNKWNFKEVDVESMYWVDFGQLGGHFRIFDGPNSFTIEYIFRLTLEMAELIANNPEHVLGVCNKAGILYFLGTSMSIDDLKKFIYIKKETDKQPNLPAQYHKG